MFSRAPVELDKCILLTSECQTVPVKKEEDGGLQIKEENLRDGHSGEMHPERGERGVKESSDKKGDKETSRGDDSAGDGSTEVRKAQSLSAALNAALGLCLNFAANNTRHTAISFDLML